MMLFTLHVTCSCIFMHMYLTFNIFVYIWTVWDFSVCFSLPLFFLVYVSASMTPKCKFAPSRNPLHSKASSSSDPTPSSIWFYDEDAWKDFSENFSLRGATRCSFGTTSHFGGLCRHWPTRCHSQSGLGVIVWRLGHMSFCVDPGVLLQHAWTWFFNTSLSYSCLRYVHYCHTGVGIWCAPCPEGRASWLPWVWVPEDCVQRRDDFYFLRAPFWLGWSSIYTMFNFY